mmetsp:Transcript_96310/g.299362  ORF Transcript_96310/g.299362 Transcript_96310/m.299362 type:complete len:993 (-) Transcript_96310:72-3050(-)
MARVGELCEVVGGGDKGGIIVRAGRDFDSQKDSSRLSTGALVRVLEQEDGRVRYEIVAGVGPACGWVSTSAGGRALLAKAGAHGQEAQNKPEATFPSLQGSALQSYGQRFSQEAPHHDLVFDFKTGQFRREAPNTEVKPSWVAPAEPEEVAHKLQGRRGFFAGRESLRNRPKAAQLHQVHTQEAARRLVLSQDDSKVLARGLQLEASRTVPAVTRDNNKEETHTCPLCRLPMGSRVCRGEDGQGAAMHGECMAQFTLLRMKVEEDTRLQEDAALKCARHREHDIGWSAARIPRNLDVVRRMDSSFVSRGMVCLVLDEDDSLRLAPTCEPSAAVNLEYLLLALQVKRSTGREALFSLDPAPRKEHDAEGRKQVKRFEPQWLAATSAGDVLFQADYYLKELSMGEHDQPIIGMKSCFDIAVAEGLDKRWQGREWYIVRKADVQLSEDNVLIPTVKMGVEAREQIPSHGNGLRDAPITRPDHPMVKYAEAFTRNFDLIAERKGAVHHLREFAKASVLARFLLDAGVSVPDSWFTLADEEVTHAPTEIPQLWNERSYGRLRMRDGALVDAEAQEGPARVGIYGGVELQLGIQAPPGWGMTYMEAAAGAAAQVPGAVVPAAAGVAVAPGAGVARAVRSRRQAMKMRATRRGPRILSGGAFPQGVDLDLESFDLLDAGHVAGRCMQSAESAVPLGQAFWAGIAGSEGLKSAFNEKDTTLLQKIYNLHLCDRREEGELFTPPSTAGSYVEKLRMLVQAEEEVRRQRREHFLSPTFVVDDAGPLFPSSWTSHFGIELEGASGREHMASAPRGVLHPRPDHKPSRESLRSAQLVFDKTTEDGTHFRIYRPGSIEVRTIQEFHGEETIGMVFSTQALPSTGGSQGGLQAKDHESIAKATVYVESASLGSSAHHCYLVLKTEAGSSIVTERLRAGTLSWEENPADLELRNSLAKVLHSEHLVGTCGTVGNLRALREAARQRDTSDSTGEEYALEAYRQAGGKL